MLLKWLLSWLVIPPLVTQASSIVKPRVDGNVQADDDVCSEYATCAEKGLEYWNKLHTTLSQAQQGLIIDRNDRQSFQTHYFAKYESSFLADPELQLSLQNRGIDAKVTKMDMWQISGLDPDTLRPDVFPAYHNIFDTHNGIIIAEANQRLGDRQKALPWSELMYQTWQLAEQKANLLASKDHPPGGPISNLRSVVQHIIHNKGTQQVLKAAYEANGWVPGYDGAEQWRKWTEQNTKHFFFGLLGTDNVKGTVWLLNDHANEIGLKDISAIWTRWYMGNPDIWYVNDSVPRLQYSHYLRTPSLVPAASYLEVCHTNLDPRFADFSLGLILGLRNGLRPLVPRKRSLETWPESICEYTNQIEQS